MSRRFKKISTYAHMMMIMMIVVVAAACGKAPAPETKPSASVQPSSSAQASAKPADNANETISYTAENGVVKLKKNPQRVVVLESWYVGFFLAIGIKPVAVTQGAFDNPFFKGKLDGVENLGDGKSVEKILELNPDLIIAFDGNENLEKIQSIAPTVAVKYGKLNYKDQIVEFGKMTGKEDKAKEWVANWNKKIADYKPKVEAAVGSKTVSILNPYAKGLYVFGHNYGRGGEIIYDEFKLKAPPEAQKAAIDSKTGWASISLEKLPEYAGDFIFTSPWSGDTADPDTVYGSTIWKSLPAVKENRVFQVDPKAFTFNDPISLEAELGFIMEKLTQK